MSRLLNVQAISSLQNFLGFHLGEQHHAYIDCNDAKCFSEEEKLLFLPHVFGLMPMGAAFKSTSYIEVKPLIVRHLDSIGVMPTDILVSIIKDLCDNFDRTRHREGSPALRPRKSSIGDLRQQTGLYKSIRERQGARCNVCGARFSGAAKEETLDHVIPWRLGGDPPGGWNWQLLCRQCNNAKSTLFSAYSTPEYSNWIFAPPISSPSARGDELTETGRYLALRHFGSCDHENCGSKPIDTELFVVRKCESGFSVLDHLAIRCDLHKNTLGSVVG